MRMPIHVEAAILCGGLLLTAPQIGAGQQIPISGLSGTVAIEGTVGEGSAANTIIVTTIDGVRHVFEFTRDLLVHGGKGGGALQGLREGTTVVVHYTVAGPVESAQEIDWIGDDGLKVTEGVATRVDRRRDRLTIRFDNGKSETFQLTARAAAGAGRDIERAGPEAAKVIVYYSDEPGGRKVAHFFKKIP